jgi:hypothetical protein
MDKEDLLLVEKGTIRKKMGGRIPCFLSFSSIPITWGMSNLATHTSNRMLMTATMCVRTALLRGSRPLVSLESSRPLSSFEIVFFTLSFELDYPNIVKVLEGRKPRVLARERRRVPPLYRRRRICVIANPEPISPFLSDLMVIGDIEPPSPPSGTVHRGARPAVGTGIIDHSRSAFCLQSRGALGVLREEGKVEGFEPADLSPLRYRGALHGRYFWACPSSPRANTEFADMVLVEGNPRCPRAALSASSVASYNGFRSEDVDATVERQRRGHHRRRVSFHPRIAEIVESPDLPRDRDPSPHASPATKSPLGLHRTHEGHGEDPHLRRRGGHGKIAVAPSQTHDR